MAQLTRIKVKNFRNLMAVNLDFQNDQNIVVFLGKNGQGKTNLLEGIYLCALSKSFRGKNTDLIQFERDFCSIESHTSEDQVITIVITKTPVQKALKINGVKTTAAKFIGHLKAVFFSPDDLSQMSFAPKLRRRYLDVLLTQLNPEYLEWLMGYEEARKQRNALLKKMQGKNWDASQLIFWDEQLAQYGHLLINARLKLIEEIKPIAQKHYQSIAESQENINITYKTSHQEEPWTAALFLKNLRENHQKDLLSGRTQWGPHVDDLIFYLSGRDMQHFASRGEWRSLVLALKFAELELLRSQTGKEPILLLDDVFSELDEDRQQYLFKAIGKAQTFITTTHEVFFKSIKDKVSTYTINAGKLVEKIN